MEIEPRKTPIEKHFHNNIINRNLRRTNH